MYCLLWTKALKWGGGGNLNYLSIDVNLLFPLEEGDSETDESITAYQEEETWIQLGSPGVF